ncbi:MAG: diguanylate cyclase [Pseudorhodobacter sp.]|nr:diguanylate cyclase [Rhizobacter sp.]
MLIPRFTAWLRDWVATLKFKIIVMAIVTAVMSAAVTTQLVLTSNQADLERLLLRQDAEDRERSAALLSTKIQMLETVLKAVTRRVEPRLLDNPEALIQYLRDKPAIDALFDSVFVARPNGEIVVRLQQGVVDAAPPNVRDRDYFQRVLRTSTSVVSGVMLGRASKVPIVVFAVPVKSSTGEVIAVVGGSLSLRDNGILSNISREQNLDRVNDLVIDANGRILAHSDSSRLLGKAEDEPGFADTFGQWVANGSTFHAEGISTRTQGGFMVSMAALTSADWMVVRVTPEAVALQPLRAAKTAARRAAAAVGLSAALLAALFAWFVTKPIGDLRRRAEHLLSRRNDIAWAEHEDWPSGRGEVGQLGRAFKHLMEQRQQREHETQALLRQLEAVLDNAEVGIAFSRRGKFELVSRNLCRMLDWDKSQVTGQSTRLIYPSEAAYVALGKRARPSFMLNGTFQGEVQLARRSGETFWAHMSGRALVAGDTAQGTIWIIRDVTQAREQQERLAWSASHDALTGLANRPHFEVLLEQATQHALDHPFCALFIDLDRFKEVNDTAGHAAGDALLRDIAHKLVAEVRQSDTVARLGGDEFAVLLHRCPPAQAVVVAEKLRAAVESYELVWESRCLTVGASIGLVAVDASFGSQVDVLRAADSACYAAKRGGRNRVALYSRDLFPDHPLGL